MKKSAILIIAIFCASGAHAESWRVAGGTEEYPANITFIDADSIKRSGDIADFRIRQFDEDYGQSWMEQRINTKCSKNGYSISSSTMLENGVVKKAKNEPKAVAVVAPGSVDDLMVRMACGTLKLPIAPVTNIATFAADYFLNLDIYNDDDY